MDEPTPQEEALHIAKGIAIDLEYARGQLSRANSPARTRGTITCCVQRAQDGLERIAEANARLADLLAKMGVPESGNAPSEWTMEEILSREG